jgi:hypothetical protein
MKRRKPIDPQGHDPKPAAIPAAEECRRCCDYRRKDQPWRRPCPPSAADRAERRYMADPE